VRFVSFFEVTGFLNVLELSVFGLRVDKIRCVVWFWGGVWCVARPPAAGWARRCAWVPPSLRSGVLKNLTMQVFPVVKFWAFGSLHVAEVVFGLRFCAKYLWVWRKLQVRTESLTGSVNKPYKELRKILGKFKKFLRII